MAKGSRGSARSDAPPQGAGRPRTLDEVPPEHSATIIALGGAPAFCSRLRTMGVVEGERVGVVKHAPLADPIEYRVRRIHVTLRREEARRITVADIRDDLEEQSSRPRCQHNRKRRGLRRLFGGR